ncbi:hypothetical protein ABRP58_05570 [Pectobacterium aroidearum]|uniref:hypothetical protein n=1 Tax=Pectobacterium aroidearum TaxID=1201031 RepID=UPI0032F04F5E
MKHSSIAKKKEVDIHNIRLVLMPHTELSDKGVAVFKYFTHLRNKNINASYYSYENFLEMAEARDVMDFRYKTESYDVANVISYGSEENTIEDYINWVSITLKYYADDINSFIIKKNEFTYNLLLSNYDKAKINIEEIESFSGKSLWSITNYLSILYFSQETQEYNNLSKKLFSISHELSRSYLNYEYIRCNNSISPERYHFFIGKMIEELRLSSDTDAESLLLYRHAFDPSFDYLDIPRIYKQTYEQRLIDLYCSFIKILSYLEIKGISIERCRQRIVSLSSMLKDRELKIISHRLFPDKQNATDELQQAYDVIINNYLIEDYSNVISIAESTLSKVPGFSVLYIPYIKSLIKKGERSNLNGLIGNITNNICSLFQEDNFEQRFEEINKLYHVLLHNPWAQVFSCILAEFNGSDSLNIPPKFNYLDNTSLYYNKLSLREDNTQYYYRDEVPEWRKNKYLAELNYYNNNYEKSLHFYNLINEKHNEQVKSKIIQCLFHLDKKEQAIEISCTELLNGKNPKSLPLVLLSKDIDNSSKYSADNNILLNKAVTLHYYNIYYNNEYVQTLSNICENYLENLGIYDVDQINHKEPIDTFMLEKILTLDVLDGISSIIENDADLLKCRLKINREILATESIHTKDEINKSIEEIRYIFYKTVVEVCSIEAGEGKIHVDKAALKNKILGDLNKFFNNITAETDREVEFKINENVDVFYTDSNEKLSYYTSEKLFINKTLDLLYFIFSSYSLDKLYGLDQSLNMGIRHGGLVNLLWSPLKNNNLAALKSNDTAFQPNPIWRNLFGYHKESVLIKVDNTLIDFNIRMHKLINGIKSKVNVNMGEFNSSDKWFNYLPDFDLQLSIATKIDSYTPEILLDEVFMYLDEYSDSILEKIRTNYIPELEKLIMDEIDSLERELNGLKINFVNLKRSISKSKVDMKDSLDILFKWFAWSGESKTPFDMKAAMNKAISAVEQFHSWMNITLIQKNYSNTQFKGKYFTDTVMILTLLFENAVKHSNFKDSCDINIHVYETDHRININVCNKIQTELNENEQRIIKSINDDLEKNILDNSTKDNGSGLYKVKKILTHHLKTDSSVHISCKDTEFKVIISFSKTSNIVHE